MISIPFTIDYEPWAAGQRNLRRDRAMVEAMRWSRDQIDEVTRREIVLTGFSDRVLVSPAAARRLARAQF